MVPFYSIHIPYIEYFLESLITQQSLMNPYSPLAVSY
jgi:hypothetical protein